MTNQKKASTIEKYSETKLGPDLAKYLIEQWLKLFGEVKSNNPEKAFTILTRFLEKLPKLWDLILKMEADRMRDHIFLPRAHVKAPQ